MNVGKVKKGMIVAVSSDPEAQLYEVANVSGFAADLIYYSETGFICDGGQIAVSVLQSPSREQIKNSVV